MRLPATPGRRLRPLSSCLLAALAAACLAPPLLAAQQMSLSRALQVLRQKNPDPDELFSLSFYLQQAGRPFSALHAMERAISLAPRKPGFHARYGQLLLARQRLREAATAFHRAAEIDPQTRSFIAAEARALSQCGMLEQATGPWARLLKACEREDEILDAARNLAGLHYRLGAPARAQAAWEQALARVKQWKNRLGAAKGVEQALQHREQHQAVVELWLREFAAAKQWQQQAEVMELMLQATVRAGKKRTQLLQRVATAGKTLLLQAKADKDKQRAARLLARTWLTARQPRKASAVLAPMFPAPAWEDSLQAAHLLASAAALAGEQKRCENAWRTLLARAKTAAQYLQAADRLCSLLGDPRGAVSVYEQGAGRFASDRSVAEKLGRALARAGEFQRAAAAMHKALRLQRREPRHRVGQESSLRRKVIELYVRAFMVKRAVDLAVGEFANTPSSWNAWQWLRAIRDHAGKQAARAAAGRFAVKGRFLRLAAGRFLQGLGDQEQARALLTTCAGDTGLPRGSRREAQEALLLLARSATERIAACRQLLSLANGYWQKRSDSMRLATHLARAGLVAPACQVVRQADSVRQYRSIAGPETLMALARNLVQGHRTGPGLRSAKQVRDAEQAALSLLGDLGAKTAYRSAFGMLFNNLSGLRVRRGEAPQALDLLRKATAVRPLCALNLAAGRILQEQGKDQEALAEYVAYAAALARERAQMLIQRRARLRPREPVTLDRGVLKFLANKGLDKKFEGAVREHLEAAVDLEQECVADVLLGFLRSRNRAADMGKVLTRLRSLGHNPAPYSRLQAWIAGAQRMGNAASMADARMRSRLLGLLRRFQDTSKRNPEDYQAALNAAKVLVNLGRSGEAEPWRKRAVAVAPQDPVVLERYGRELMLRKGYDDAAAAFEAAAKISGRREPYLKSMLSARELAGDYDQAIDLVLASMRQAGNRPARSPQQVLDMARRSDNLGFLLTRVRQELAGVAKTGAAPQLPLLHLALLLAWDRHDAKLATAATGLLVRKVRIAPVLRSWYERRGFERLAARAQALQHLDDAVRIRQALLEARLGQGAAPSATEFAQLARLLLLAGKAAQAAQLMFDGLERALAHGVVPTRPRPVPIPIDEMPLNLRRHKGEYDWHPGSVLLRQDLVRPWSRVILLLAARAARSGEQGFARAAGKRLQDLVEQELAHLARDPLAYKGPLDEQEVLTGLDLGGRVAAALRAAQGKAESSRLLLAIARRLARLTGAAPVGFKDIARACEQATTKVDARERGRVLLEAGKVYARLLEAPADKRLAGCTPQPALDALAAAAAAGPEAVRVEALHLALQVAKRAKLHEQACKLAGALYALPSQREAVRGDYALALLRVHKAKEASGVLQAGLGQDAGYDDYRRAALTCLQAKGDKAAAATAIRLLEQAIAIYRREAGEQVNAMKEPVPDLTLGGMQLALMRANATAGQPQPAVEAFLASMFNRGRPPAENGLRDLLGAFPGKEGGARLAARLQRAVKKQPHETHLRLALAEALLVAGKAPEAAAAMQAAKALDPDLRTVKRLIEMLRRAGNLRAALDECRGWAENFPRDREAWRTMAAIYRDLHDAGGELRAVTMLVEAAPREADNCREVAVLFVKRKDQEHARALLERAAELRPGEPFRLVDLAEVLFMAGEHEKAEHLCKRALTGDWRKGVAPELLARLPSQQGTFENRAHSLLADIYAATGRKDLAARERLPLPAGYKRPPLREAAPRPGRRPRHGPGPRPLPPGGPPVAL